MSKLENTKIPLDERKDYSKVNLTTKRKRDTIKPAIKAKTKTKRKDNMSYNKIKQYASVLLLAIGFIKAGYELSAQNPVLSIGVGILALLLVESALQSKSK